jgi:hypothetical protein
MSLEPIETAPRGHAFVAFCSILFSAAAILGLLCLSAINNVPAGA